MLSKDFYPIPLYCDNLAAQISAQISGSNKLRHVVERRENYVKECVKRNDIMGSF